MSEKKANLAILMTATMSVLLPFFSYAADTAAGGDNRDVVASIEIKFDTAGDNKDGDTQVRSRLVIDGQDYARLYCCNAGKHSKEDHWNDRTSNTRKMDLLKSISRQDIHRATMVFGSQANGNDKWIFTPTVTVNYKKGPSETFTFEMTTLDSHNSSEVRKEYPISK